MLNDVRYKSPQVWIWVPASESVYWQNEQWLYTQEAWIRSNLLEAGLYFNDMQKHLEYFWTHKVFHDSHLKYITKDGHSVVLYF